jgi:hypothetical protein
LLEALSRRQRPDRPGAAVAESSGAVAAPYYGKHAIHEATKTPAPLPSIVVTRTAEMPTVPGARLAPSEPAPTPASFAPGPAPAPAPAPRPLDATVIPGRRSPLGPFVAVAVALAVLLIAGAFVYRSLERFEGVPHASGSASPVASTPAVIVSAPPTSAPTAALPALTSSAMPPAPAAPVLSAAAPTSAPSAAPRPVATEVPAPRSTASPPPAPRTKPAPRPTTTSDDLIEHPW